MPMPPAVADAFAALPSDHCHGLIRLRELIFDVADEVAAAPLNEVLTWSQPSYLSARPGVSTAIRLGANARDNRYFGLFFHCQSTVLRDFKATYPTEFRYDGNRAILFQPGEDMRAEKLRQCIGHALCYRSKPPDSIRA